MLKEFHSIIVSEEVLEFHKRALVIDLHTDCLIASRVLGLDLGKRHRAPWGLSSPWFLHADIPKMREGGIDAVFFGIVTHPLPLGAYDRAWRNIKFAHYTFRKHSDRLFFTLKSDDIIEAKRKGKIAALLGVEGMHMLNGAVDRISDFYDKGVRYITMAHFTSNKFAASSADPFKKEFKLGKKGVEAVELMNELGMMIDVSHTHSDVLRDVCRISTAPVIASHTATRALRPVFRNMSDNDIKIVAETGGVIGLIYASDWLSGGIRRTNLSAVVDHADHIKKIVGTDFIALGSDWDGFIRTPREMKDASDLPALTQLFFERGYKHEEVEKILGLNFLRVFRQVESNSGRYGT